MSARSDGIKTHDHATSISSLLVAADQQENWNLDSNEFISSRTHKSRRLDTGFLYHM